MTFDVVAIDSSGVRRTFRRDAPDEASLRLALKSGGMVPVSAAPAKSAAAAPRRVHRAPGRFSLFPMSALEVEMGLRQLSAMLAGGVALLPALSTVCEQAMSKAAHVAWQGVADEIERGESLSAALERRSGRFGDMTVRLAEVGERTGELAHALSKAADQLESRRSLRSAVVNALAYPLVAMVMAFAVGAYLVAAVIPKLADFLRSGGVALPHVTQMLMDFSDWIVARGPALAAGAAAAALALVLARMWPPARQATDAAALRIPVAGKILRLSETALFARSMQIMSEAGVSLIDALTTASMLPSNLRFRRRIREARDGVMRGKSLDDALSGATEFTPMLRRMAAVGAVSGSLPETFGETARFHEMLLALAVKRLGMLMEPVMICITGAIVGFVYIAFFTALFSIAGMN